MHKQILLLGASSNVGSNILYEIKENKIDGIIRKNISHHSISKKKRLLRNRNKLIKINNKNISTLGEYPIIINCIGLTKNYNNSKYIYSINKNKFISYSKNILKIIKITKCKVFIHIGSSMEYRGIGGGKINEDSKTSPDTNYGKLKKFETDFFNKKLKKTNVKLIILRLFSIYGIFLKSKSLIDQILFKKKIILSNPNTKIDIINFKYLCHIIQTLIKQIKNFKGNFYIVNCTSGNSIKLKKLVNTIKNKSKSQRLIEYRSNQSATTERIGSSYIIKKKLKIKSFNIGKNIKAFTRENK
jgi:nucleoside-diphosphate-sugar epimerase